MKKLILFIAIGLFGMSAHAQAQDPVIVGARKYLKTQLTVPTSYVEYNVVKKSFREGQVLIDEYHTIKDVHLWDWESTTQKLITSETNAIINLEVNLSKLKTKLDDKDYYKGLPKNYFINDSIMYQKYKPIFDTIIILQKDTTKEALPYIRVFLKNEITGGKYGNESLVFDNYMQLYLLNDSYKKRDEQLIYLERVKEIGKRLEVLKKNPSLDKVVYYSILFNYSCTNQYGSRGGKIEDVIFYKDGVYTLNLSDINTSK
jgi:hypothetical protein